MVPVEKMSAGRRLTRSSGHQRLAKIAWRNSGVMRLDARKNITSSNIRMSDIHQSQLRRKLLPTHFYQPLIGHASGASNGAVEMD